MLCLVTGGAGFIGSHLVDALCARGLSVRVLDNLSTGRRENLALSQAEFVEGDIRDREVVRKCMREVDVVFHQAALGSVARSVSAPLATVDVNVVGTCQVLHEARAARVKRVIFASSSSVYGDTPCVDKHEGLLPAPNSPYAASKAAGESLMRAFHETYGLKTVSLRYFNVYGPRQLRAVAAPAVVPMFFDACAAGYPMPIEGDGQQTRDFTYVEDVCEALLRAMMADCADGRVLNAAAGIATSILSLGAEVARTCGVPFSIQRIAPRAGDVRYSRADVTHVANTLGWTAQTRLIDGLRMTSASLAS